MALVATGLRGRPLSRAWSSLANTTVEPLLCRGRYEGTDKFLGRNDSTERSLHSSSERRANLKKCLVQPRWCTPYGNEDSTRCQGLTTLILNQSGKKAKKSALRGSVSLDNRGPHKC